MATAYKKNSMYEVEVTTCFLTRKSTQQIQKRKPRLLPIELWHHRLGHLNLLDIYKLTDIAIGIQICPKINN